MINCVPAFNWVTFRGCFPLYEEAKAVLSSGPATEHKHTSEARRTPNIISPWTSLGWNDLTESRRGAPHRVYQHYSYKRILVVGKGQQLNIGFINQQSYERLLNSGLQHIHLGLMMVQIYALHRRDAGTNVLVVLEDTRWQDDSSIIETMEVDMALGTQLVYITPNMMMSIHDFYNHVELASRPGDMCNSKESLTYQYPDH